MITTQQALEYEIAGTWWTQYIGIPWLQNLASLYFVRKVKRKIARYNKNFNKLQIKQTKPEL